MSGHLIDDPFSPGDRRWVLDCLGEDVLAWAAAVSPEDIRDRLVAGEPLPTTDIDLLFDDFVADCLRVRADLASGDEAVQSVDRAVVEGFVAYDPALQMSKIGVYRVAALSACANPPPEPTLSELGQGPTERCVAVACWEAYPALLTNTWLIETGFDIQRAREVLGNDPRLEPWWSTADERIMLASTGHGQQRNSAEGVLAGCLQFAWHAQQETGARGDIYGLIQHALTALSMFVEWADRKVVRLPATIGFGDVEVPADLKIETEAGTLRAAGEERDHVTRELVGMVLRTTLPVRVDAVVLDADWDFRTLAGREDYQRERRRRADEVVLAFALAFGSAGLPRPAWTRLNSPLVRGTSAELHEAPVARGVAVSAKRTDELAHWLRVFDRLQTTRYDIAIRRTAASLYERSDPQDALIDAVVAWDSLVGAAGETTLRVTIALARLLGQTSDEREALRSTLSDIYKLRSAIVHGNRMVGAAEAAQAHEQAVDLSLRALATLLEGRPELADLDSAARSRALLLGS